MVPVLWAHAGIVDHIGSVQEKPALLMVIRK